MSEYGATDAVPSRSARIRALDESIADLVAELHEILALDDDDDLYDDLPKIHSRPTSFEADVEVAPPTTPGYRRDRLGRWRYERGNLYVPGARDARLGELYGRWRDANHVYLPTPVLRAVPILAAFRTYPLGVHGATPCVLVPVGEWDRYAHTTVGLSAPELAPWSLLDTAGFAALLNVAPRTISAYLARHQVPSPVARVGSSPVWSVPVLLEWLMSRGR